MARRALLVRLVVTLLRVAGEAGRTHRTDRRPALGPMTSRSGTPRGVDGASVRLAGSRMTRGAIPFAGVVFAVTRRACAFDGSLPPIRVTTGAFESRVLVVRESDGSRSRLRPHREGECRGDRTRRPDLGRGMTCRAVSSSGGTAVMTALTIAGYRNLEVSMPGARAVACGAGDRRMSRMLKACG